MSKKIELETCDLCGENRSLKKIVNKNCCSMCRNLVSNINRRPELAVDLLVEFYGDQYLNAGTNNAEELAELRGKLADRDRLIKNIVEEFDGPLGDGGLENLPRLIGELVAAMRADPPSAGPPPAESYRVLPGLRIPAGGFCRGHAAGRRRQGP